MCFTGVATMSLLSVFPSGHIAFLSFSLSSVLSICPLTFLSSSIILSQIDSWIEIAFSDEHDVELSNVFDLWIQYAACVRLADGSMIVLTLPAPTVIQGVPAAFTTLIRALPPVATAKSHVDISSTVFSFVGS